MLRVTEMPWKGINLQFSYVSITRYKQALNIAEGKELGLTFTRMPLFGGHKRGRGVHSSLPFWPLKPHIKIHFIMRPGEHRKTPTPRHTDRQT